MSKAVAQQPCRQRRLIVVAQDEVGAEAAQQGGIALGVAAGDGYARSGREAAGETHEVTGLAAGDVGDGAGVDDEGIGGGGCVDHLAAGGRQVAGNRLRFRLVQLAAEGQEGNATNGAG